MRSLASESLPWRRWSESTAASGRNGDRVTIDMLLNRVSRICVCGMLGLAKGVGPAMKPAHDRSGSPTSGSGSAPVRSGGCRAMVRIQASRAR